MAAGRGRHRAGKISIEVCVRRTGNVGRGIFCFAPAGVREIETAVEYREVMAMELRGESRRVD